MLLVGQTVRALRNDQLPNQRARRFVKTLHESHVLAPVPWVTAKGHGVGADEDLAPGNGGVPIGGGTQASCPFHVVHCRWITVSLADGALSRSERVGQARLCGDHAAAVTATPLWPVSGEEVGRPQCCRNGYQPARRISYERHLFHSYIHHSFSRRGSQPAFLASHMHTR